MTHTSSRIWVTEQSITQKFSKRFAMNNGRWVIILAVSLYVLFFVTAFYSALAASFTGSTGDLAGIVEEQSVACELMTGATADQQGPHL